MAISSTTSIVMDVLSETDSLTANLSTAASTVASVLFQLGPSHANETATNFSSAYLNGSTFNISTSNATFNGEESIPFVMPTFSEYAIMVVSCLFYSTAFLLGAIGNGLIIYIVAQYSRMRSLCNVFLASLATADFLLVCVCIPVKMVQLVTYTWTLGDATCKLLHYVQNVSAFCSVLTLTTMSVERYWAILHPVECRTTFSMHHIQKIIVVIWIAALILAAPTLFIFVQMPVGEAVADGRKAQYWYCVKKSRDQANWMKEPPEIGEQWELIRKVYELYMFALILVLPVLIMSFTYARICTHLWSIISRRTAIRYGHSCHAMSKVPKTPKTVVASNKTQVITVVSPIGGSGTTTTTDVVVTTATSKATLAAKTSSSYTSSSASTVSLSTSSTAQLHQDCRRSMEEDNATVKQVIKMLVAVVLLFLLCWAPMMLINVLRAFEFLDDLNHGLLKQVAPVTYLLAYLNSVINPFIYGFMSKNFRLYFKIIFSQLADRFACFGLFRGGAGDSFGSTKSDASNRQKTGHYAVRMDRLQGHQMRGVGGYANAAYTTDYRKKTTVPVSVGAGAITGGRKPSDPKTELVSVNDTLQVVPVQVGDTDQKCHSTTK